MIKQLLAILTIAISILTFACPKRDIVRGAASASYRLPGLTRDAIKATGDAFDRKLISIEQKDKFALIFQRLANNETRFVALVDDFRAVYERTQAIDKSRLDAITAFFDAEIVDPFLQILTEYKLLSGSAAGAVKIAIEAVRVVLIQIGAGFGSTKIGSLKTL
jgi:hypothetical protein